MKNRRRIVYWFAALALVGLSGCVTQEVAPIAMSVDKTRTYNASFDVVWPAIIGSVADQNLPVTTLEKASGLIAISGVSYSPDDAQEGMRGLTMGTPDQVISRSAKFNIFATKTADGGTNVRVNTSFMMQVRSGNGSQMFPFRYRWEQAYSNGNFEKIILNEIAYRIEQQ